MKESSLLQMKNKIDTLGSVIERLIQETEMLKTLVMGDHAVIKELKEFPDIIEKMKQDNGKEENTERTATGDSNIADSGLELS